MTQVQTVTGPIDVEQMGATLVHEHIFVMNEEYRLNYADWDEQAQVADAVEQLTQLKGLGIDTIMDPTVLGLGRYIPRVQRIAQQVELNIVVATGVYTYNEVPFQFHHSGPGLLFDQPEPMVQLFLKDLNDGIADTGVRAAFLKCAIEEQGLTPGVERVMRAVGATSAQSGASITAPPWVARARSGTRPFQRSSRGRAGSSSPATSSSVTAIPRSTRPSTASTACRRCVASSRSSASRSSPAAAPR